MNEVYLSLYDFLKRAAGAELGKEVEQAARQKDIIIRYKSVSNPVYTGKINMYPISFLQEYFKSWAKKHK